MFTPHVTVACVVQAQNQFLIVEETIRHQQLWNQPAGHLEDNETLLQAAERELWEEAGIRATPQSLLKVLQWRTPKGVTFVRFTFAIDLEEPITAIPQDPDIDRCLWLPAQQILAADNLRSPLVGLSLLAYQQGPRYPLDLLSTYQGSVAGEP
ncbi:MAG: NUDIX domain-containing protein [Enterobacteriaceae bacterium]